MHHCFFICIELETSNLSWDEKIHVCQECIELGTSNLSWDEKLFPNKIMFVKYVTKSQHLSTPTAARSTQHQSLENPSIKIHIDAPLLIHLNTLNYLPI
jgi:hypothetical protein